MEEKKNSPTKRNLNNQKNQGTKVVASFNIDIKEILNQARSKWYWFIVSLIVCVGSACLYLMYTPPMYDVKSRIILLNEENSRQNSSIDLTTLGIKDNNRNVPNELFVIESPLLMREVITKLGLNNRYFTNIGLREDDLYKKTPIIVTPVDSIPYEYYSFVIDLDGNGGYKISEITDQDPEKSVSGKLGQQVKTPIGEFVIGRSPWYVGNQYTASKITFRHSPIDDIGAAFPGVVTAKMDDDRTSVVTIYVDDISYERALDVNTTLIDVYSNKLAEDRTKSDKSTAEFIDNRLAIIEEDLGNVEGDISSYKSQNKLPDVNMSSALYFSSSFENKSELLNLNSEMAMAQYVRRQLVNEGIENTLPPNTGLESPGVDELISDYNRLVMERNRLLSSSSESNPVVSDLTTMLTTLKRNIISSLDNYITTLNHRLSNIETSDSQANNELTANPDREKYLLKVERQQKVKEQLYVFLLQKRLESELAQAYIKDNITVLSQPSGSQEPFTPERSRILITAFLIGLVIPFLIIYLREALNSVVRNRRDIGMLSMPFVGEIPYGPGRRIAVPAFLRKPHSAQAKDVVVKEGSTNVINEAFRAIRTSLEFMNTDGNTDGGIISFTSACSGSGKTFIVMNLATALALGGKKVCVVDLDMRKAALSRWGGHTDRGISNLLIGQSTINDIILHNINDNKNIDMVPVGILPPNPVELLSHRRLKEFFETLREEYDYVLVDCPPAEIVADARLISKYVDMTIFVIRAGLFEKSMLPDLEEYAATDRYHNLAVLLNGTDPNSMYRRTRYGYGYAYGYVKRK